MKPWEEMIAVIGVGLFKILRSMNTYIFYLLLGLWGWLEATQPLTMNKGMEMPYRMVMLLILAFFRRS